MLDQPPLQARSPPSGVNISLIGSKLNEKQEQVVTSFLSSPRGSLHVVQGPPGCGKSTLVVSLIRNFLANRPEGSKEKIMVCAPTNKAIAVLADRTLSEICTLVGKEPIFNITVIGDDEKLTDGFGANSHLRPYCLYKIFEVIKSDFSKALDSCDPDPKVKSIGTCITLAAMARRTQTRLKNRLKMFPESIFTAVESLCDKLESYNSPARVTRKELSEAANAVLQSFDKGIPKEKRMHISDELVSSSDVIFSTLCSAGSPILRFNATIDALLVDEAAAATEPSLYIPMMLEPKRMLIVGDPKQLPAVVTSKLANKLGLSESLHERLMNRCGCKHTLLEEQYRMHSEIAVFPSDQFYAGKILNGVNVTNADYGTNGNIIEGGKRKPFLFCKIVGNTKQLLDKELENIDEAKAVVTIVEHLSRQGCANWNSVRRLRVISFYRAQVALIGKLLSDRGIKNFFVATVDPSQGCEADVVIVSFVKGCRSAGFLKDDHRINVALTRAEHQLICVGNVDGLLELEDNDAKTLRLLAEEAQDRRGVVQKRLPAVPTRPNNAEGALRLCCPA